MSLIRKILFIASALVLGFSAMGAASAHSGSTVATGDQQLDIYSQSTTGGFPLAGIFSAQPASTPARADVCSGADGTTASGGYRSHAIMEACKGL